MKEASKKGFDIYNSIISGEVMLDSLSDEDISLLFEYLCEETEEGREIDRNIFEKCADRIPTSAGISADEIIEKTYRRIYTNPKKHKFVYKNCIRRIFAAVLAATVFVVTTFITAAAFKVDIVEQVKTVFTVPEKNEEPKHDIYLTDSRNGNEKLKVYKDPEIMFKIELKGYLYPTELPENMTLKSAEIYSEESRYIFSVTITDENSQEDWSIVAKPAVNKLPMGYEYSVDFNGKQLDFVYNLDRNGENITGYTLYTIYNNVQYTFRLHTSDWNDVLTVIESLSMG